MKRRAGCKICGYDISSMGLISPFLSLTPTFMPIWCCDVKRDAKRISHSRKHR